MATIVNELRIGNLIYANKKITKVITVMELGINYDFDNETDKFWFSELNPIPVTENVLNKTNLFKMNKSNIWGTDCGTFVVELTESNTCNFILNNEISIVINSLHHLQNIYFSIIGEELCVDSIIE